MVDARQLRIGNLLQIAPISIPKLDMYGDGKVLITGEGISLIEQGLLQGLNYILLSREVFLDFGFNFFVSNLSFGVTEVFSDSLTASVVFYSLDGARFICRMNDRDIVEIDYAHQLQNLWFALKGEELNYET